MSFDDIVQTPGAEAPAAAPEAAPKKAKAPVRRQPVAGGLPRVSLLPPEVRDAGRTAFVRRLLIGGVAASVTVAVAGSLLAGAVAATANDRLTAANDRTQSLAAQVAKFSDVSRLDQQLALGKAAATVGASTEVDWSAQYDDLVADLPYGYSVQSVTADSATATAAYDQADSPLERPRVATVLLSVDAPSTAQLPGWLRRLRSVPAYADATASWSEGSSTGEAGAGVTISVTVHLDSKALVNQQEQQ